MSDSITVTGNITEPELRRTSGGISVLSFRIASTHRVFDKTQEKWVEGSTSWYSVSAFRSLADHAFASLKKGQRVVVHGRLKLREWENGSGARGFTAEIEADSLGHDLLWGTSAFVSERERTGAAHGAAVEESWAPGLGVDDGATAAPLPDAATSESDSSEDSHPDRDLVLAGSGVDAGETPF